MNRPHLALLRCLLTWGSVTGVAGALVRLLLTDLLIRGDAAPDAFAGVLTTLCEWALVGCLGWAWLATTAVVVEVLLSHPPHPDRRGIPGVPRAWRHVVLLACGAALAAGVTVPAQATPGTVQVDATGAADDTALRGLPLPDRATDTHHSPGPSWTPDAATPPPSPVAAAARGVVVRPGDTLWAIARTDLGPGAAGTNAEVATHWREIYDLNRAVLGLDPDLIVPGQRLTLPSSHRP